MEVVQFVKKVNKNSEELSADEILRLSTNLLAEVVVLGVDTEGLLYLSSNMKTRGDIIDLMKITEYEMYANEDG
jgi:isopentenyl phosphate kinase